MPYQRVRGPSGAASLRLYRGEQGVVQMFNRNPSKPRGNRPPSLARVESLEGRRLLSTTISGMVFNDANADGARQAAEKGIANQQVYLDINFDGRFEQNEPAAITNANGQYEFDNLNAGIYRVRVIVPGGTRQTSPGLTFYDIAANGMDIHAANDFGLTTSTVLRGAVFRDKNGDGVRQSSETGFAGIVVFIDTNKNGRLDKNEIRTTTRADGTYRFNGLKPGSYVLRIGVPKGFHITTPPTGLYRIRLVSGQSLSNRNWGLV